jgi:hypothetical protein
MARAKGTKKTGGRQQGTPNKVTITTREWIQGLVNGNLAQLEKDLKVLEPRDRWAIVEKLMGYITPKLQSLDTEEQIRIEYLELERLLKASPDKAVQRIADKVMKLKELSNKK